MRKNFFISLVFSVVFASFPAFADSFSDIILNVSHELLETPYALGPLGEGVGIDADPLYRFDKFDCLTFVETVLAQSYTQNSTASFRTPSDYRDNYFKNLMNKIRYKDGIISFVTRNHFQNPDWVENNSHFVQNKSNEISKSVLNKNSSKSIIKLDRKSWFKKNYNIDFDTPIKTISLDYISLSDFKNNITKFTLFIDKPYIFMTVIKDDSLKQKAGTEIDISHTGFLIKKDGKLYLRHASSVAGKVVDNDFEKYIEKIQKNPKYMGFSLLEIIE